METMQKLRGFKRTFPISNDVKTRPSSYDPNSPYVPKGQYAVATNIVAVDGSGDFEDIQSAIDDLPAGGGVVYIKEGTYTLTSGLAINKSGISLIGSGHSTEIKAISSISNLVIIAADINYITIDNIYFNGNNSLIWSVIRFSGASSRSRISNCWLGNWAPRGITFVSAGSGITIENNIFESISAGGPNYALLVNNSSNVFLRGNYIISSTNTYGIQVLTGTCYNIMITGNQINGCVVGIWMGSSSSTCGRSIISNNELTGCNTGIRIDTSSYNSIDGNFLRGVGIGDGTGIYLPTDSGYNSISNNIVVNSQRGINIVDQYCVGNSLLGNILYDNSYPFLDSGTYTDIGHNITSC